MTTVQNIFPVVGNQEVGAEIFILRFHAPAIARSSLPGHFVNIKVDRSYYPLLRRPFSIYDVEGDDVEVVFNIVGRGTEILASKRPGEGLDVLGPLGRPYQFSDVQYSTAVIVAGGLGVAPFPFLTRFLKKEEKQIITFLGAQTEKMLVPKRLANVHLATDDGSAGCQGTVVDLVERYFETTCVEGPKFFGCGPNEMLRALSQRAENLNVPCEVSLECVMACGLGICQGCPVELRGGSVRYSLVCKEGPVYDTSAIVI
ncbi:MAG: dihydroorotate dehydrogenase electron transfer subunit [Bacteroidota bacterium]